MVGPASGQRENESCVLIGCRPKQARHASLACSRIPTLVPLEKTVLLAKNPLHTKHDYWILCLVFFFFLLFYWPCVVLVHKNPASKLSRALWRWGGEGEGGGGRHESLRLHLWNLNSTSNSPFAPCRLSCQISAIQCKAETSANSG